MTLAAALAVAAFASAPAFGGTASVSGTTVSYVAASGETNAVSVSTVDIPCLPGIPVCGQKYVIADTAGVSAGSGCFSGTSSGTPAAFCDASGITRIDVRAADGDDSVVIAGVFDSDPATILGGLGNDVLTGGPGNDSIFGYGFCGAPSCSDGADTIHGGGGDDSIDGGYVSCLGLSCPDGADTLHGDAGSDTIRGREGGDSIYGEEGADDLGGDEGADALVGGDGDDRVTPGPGPDSVDGGGNTDRVVGGGSNVTLSASALTIGDETDMLASVESATLAGTSEADTIDASAFPGPVEVDTGDGSDSIVGGAGSDELEGAGSPDTLVGNGGNDQLSGGNGTDVLSGGAGNDTFDGGLSVIDRIVESADTSFTLTDSSLTGLGSDSLTSIGTATLTAGAGDNTIDASAFNGAVILDGGAGDDTVLAGPSTLVLDDNLITGGSGADTLAGGGGSRDTLVETRNTDLTLTDSALTGTLDGDTLSGLEFAELTGGSAANTFDASGFSGNTELVGAGGDDVLIGGGLRDVLSGGDDDDTLTGGDGGPTWNDIDGGDGFDSLVEVGRAFRLTNSALFVNGEAIFDASLGAIERAVLTGTESGETLDASAFSGSVVLSGLGGNDILLGAAGVDEFDGGGGEDSIRSRDGTEESPICGPDDDEVFADALDDPADDCETIEVPPTIGVTDVSGPEGGTATFTVELSHAYSEVVTVQYATEDGTATGGADYTPISTQTLTFESGDESHDVIVQLVEDDADEDAETFELVLGNEMNAALAIERATATILDNDALPRLDITDVVVVEGHSGASQAVLDVTVSGETERMVAVNYSTADGSANAGSDYASANGTLTFLPGEGQTQEVTVDVQGDTIFEALESFAVNLTAPVNAAIGDGQGLVTIANDDPVTSPPPPPGGSALPGLTISDARLKEGNRGTKAMKFRVRLSAASATPVTVRFKTQKGTAKPKSDFVGRSFLLTFAPGQVEIVVVVKIKGDLRDERNEKFKVLLANALGATLLDAEGVGTIRDND